MRSMQLGWHTVCWSVAKLLLFLAQSTYLFCLHGLVTDGGAPGEVSIATVTWWSIAQTSFWILLIGHLLPLR